MSLSFVSSSVQTGTADGGYEETPIESQQVQEVNRRNAHKPLFEQLRENQEEEQAKQEEAQREIMRGTLALGEDDVAHLSALAEQKKEREDRIQQQTKQDLALFRAARVERQQIVLSDNEEDQSIKKKEPKTAPVAPKVVIKKRKRKIASENGNPQTKKPVVVEKPPEASALGSLLAGYGSSSDSE